MVYMHIWVLDTAIKDITFATFACLCSCCTKVPGTFGTLRWHPMAPAVALHARAHALNDTTSFA